MDRMFKVTFFVTDERVISATESESIIREVIVRNLVENGLSPMQGFEPDEIKNLTIELIIP